MLARKTMKLALVTLGVGVLLAGCVESRPAKVGTVEQAFLVGDQQVIETGARDFSFSDQEGKTHRFSEVRGDVTLVAFPQVADWPACIQCQQLLEYAERLSGATTEVGVVCIHVPEEASAQVEAAQQCRIAGRVPFVMLSDKQDVLKGLFGPNAVGKYFILDYRGRTKAEGPLDDMANLKYQLGQAAYAHQAYVNRLRGPQEVDWQY